MTRRPPRNLRIPWGGIKQLTRHFAAYLTMMHINRAKNTMQRAIGMIITENKTKTDIV